MSGCREDRNKRLILQLETGRRNHLHLEEDEMKKAIATAAMMAAFVAPTFAAGEYYVVQDVRTKRASQGIGRRTASILEIGEML
jgi:hypothetical protein